MQFRELSLAQRGFVLIAIPLVFEIVLVLGLRGLLNQSEHERERETRAKLILQAHDALFSDLYEMVRDAKIYVVNRDPSLAEKFNAHITAVDKDVVDLKMSVADNKEETALVAEIERRKNEFRTKFVEMKNLLESGRGLEAMQLFNSNRQYARSMLPLLHDRSIGLVNLEKSIEFESPKLQAGFRDKIVAMLNFGLLGNVLLAVFLAIYFNRKTAYRLRVLMDNTRRLVLRQPLNPPIRGSDEIAQLDKVFNDMAKALESASRKERALIENVADVICTITDDFMFEAVSPSAARAFDYEPERLIGRHLSDVVPADEEAKVREAFVLIKSGKGKKTVESSLLRGDGVIMEVMWSVHWLDSDQKYYCVAHNINERKQIERLKQEFVAMVSHDLRTPLTTIQMFHSLLGTGMYGELSEAGKETLSSADGNVGRLMTLVNNLLDLDKLESGQMNIEATEVVAADVLKQTLDAVGGFSEAYRVRIRVENQAGDLVADEHRLVQVMVNLASNAVKFSKKGDEVVLAAFEKDGFVHFEVRDTGRGIPAHLKDQVFERFKQVESGDAKKKGGTGLGLAICKNIVELHGGEIGVDSEEEQGSTFWFRVPKVPKTESEVITIPQYEHSK